MNTQGPLYFLAEAIPQFIWIKFCHRVNNCSQYADGFYNSMIDNKDGHIPWPLIMLTCTMLRDSLWEWQRTKGVHQKDSKLKIQVDRSARSNYFNYNNDGGKNASCCAATARKLLTLHGVANTYPFLMNTWNTVPEIYQQRVDKTLLLQLSDRSNRWSTEHLPWSPVWKKRMLTILFFLIIWPPK